MATVIRKAFVYSLMLMKELRIFLWVAGLAFLLMATQEGLEWGLYGSVTAWITLAWIQRTKENKKKAAALFLCKDHSQKAFNYVTIIIIPTLYNLFFIKSGNLPWQSPTFGILYLSIVACVLIARSGDSYVLFDEAGIKTHHEQVDYEQIGSAVLTYRWLVIDAGTDQELKIKRKLLNAEMLDFLNKRINIQT
jgi:hypothetical protein